MKRSIFSLLLSVSVIANVQGQQKKDEWSAKQAPLMTSWAAKVDPENPLPEYPRPQLVRKDWKSLNGLWEFQSGSGQDTPPFGRPLATHILVPFAPESALSGIMKHDDRLWYRRVFSIPQQWAGKNIMLNFGAIDWESEVFINGKRIGVHNGGYDAFSYDITPYLKKGLQELVVRVYDPTDSYGQPRGKQTTSPVGIMYTPTTGIWQSVWMEPVERTSIQDLKIMQDVDNRQVKIVVSSAAVKKGLTVNVRASAGAALIGEVTGQANKELTIKIPNAKLWSPDTPFLYDLKITLKDKKRVTDRVKSYFGMRKIAIQEEGGFKKIFLNNKFVYQMGVLDQGFWPDGIYTAPTDEALRYDLLQAKQMGFNLIRKHIKVEPQRWYYWADKLGLMVWQDMPSVNSYLPQEVKPPAIDKDEFKSELHRMITTHWNSPAIIVWVLFNESQGQHDTEELVKFIRETDPARLVNEASGDKFFGYGDMIDRHSYPPPSRPDSKTLAMVIGEFGGIGFKYPGHTWANKADGYTNAVNPADLMFIYKEYADQLRDFKNDNGLSGSIYTQLTDVETETNGLMTYDRVPKWDVKNIYTLNTFMFPKPVYRPVLPVAEKEPQDWKYTTAEPAANWTAMNFDDAQWIEGKGGFGKTKTFGHTTWESKDIWLRKVFNPGDLSKEQIDALVIRILYDREVEIYINGKSAFADRGSRTNYENRTIAQEARNTIVSNRPNIIAVHSRKRNGQFIDVGLYLQINKNAVK